MHGVKSRGMRIALIVLLGPILFAAQADGDDGLDLWAAAEIGSNYGSLVGQAADSAAELGKASAEFTQKIQLARERYSKAYPSGPDFAAAEAEFAKLLAEKDFHYLLMSLTFGENTPSRQLMDLLGTKIDGGIQPSARIEFYEWMEAIHERLRGQPQVSGLGEIPARVLDAIAAAQEQQAAYKLARDWAEFEAAGIKLPPPQYTALLLRRFHKYKTANEASVIYSDLLARVGETRLLSTATAIRDAPKDRVGDLVRPEALGATAMRYSGDDGADDDSPASELLVIPGGDAYLTFRSLLLSGNAPDYLTLLILERSDEGAWDNWNFAEVDAIYRKWVLAFGERAVLEAAEKVRTATKRLRDGGVWQPKALGSQRHSPYLVFQDTLAAQDPNGYVSAILVFHNNLESAEATRAAYAQLVSSYGESSVREAGAGMVALWQSPPAQWPTRFARLSRYDVAADYEVLNAVLREGPSILGGKDSLVLNAEYASWKDYSVGTAVVFQSSHWVVQGQQRITEPPSIETTITLKGRDADKVVLERSERVIGSGAQARTEQFEAPAQLTADRANPRFPQVAVATGGIIAFDRVEGQETGPEVQSLDGKSYQCRWIDWKPIPEAMRDWRLSDPSKTWVCDGVPGRFARQFSEREMHGVTRGSETILKSITLR